MLRAIGSFDNTTIITHNDVLFVVRDPRSRLLSFYLDQIFPRPGGISQPRSSLEQCVARGRVRDKLPTGRTVAKKDTTGEASGKCRNVFRHNYDRVPDKTLASLPSAAT